MRDIRKCDKQVAYNSNGWEKNRDDDDDDDERYKKNINVRMESILLCICNTKTGKQ